MPWSAATAATAKCKRQFIGFACRRISTTVSPWTCSAIPKRRTEPKLLKPSTTSERGKKVPLMMLKTQYFGLNEHPFTTSPDPRFLYFSSQVKEALAKCEFMARDRIGPIYMYGPIGSGKTSLVRRLQEKLSYDERYNVKLLISPNLKSSNAFLRLILETFDVKTERSYTAFLSNFEKFLLEQFQQE